MGFLWCLIFFDLFKCKDLI